MKNLMSSLEGELADGKTALVATSCDIERAAKYCEENYLTSTDRDKKLEKTMTFATQSLGTVAYQINKLALSFMVALEQQSDMLADIGDQIDKLKMTCNIHREKVARKAIGSCTVAKIPIKYPREPLPPEPPQKYVRRLIDYTILDHIGHGVKLQEPHLNQYGVPLIHANTVTRRSSSSVQVPAQAFFARQSSAISCRTVGPKVGSEYAASSVHSSGSLRYQSGTVGRTAGIYRTAVVPPQHLLAASGMPHHHSSGGGGSPASGSISNYATSGVALSANSAAATAEVALTATAPVGQSRRSSGSSSAGSAPIQQASHPQAHLMQMQQQQYYGQPAQSGQTGQVPSNYQTQTKPMNNHANLPSTVYAPQTHQQFVHQSSMQQHQPAIGHNMVQLSNTETTTQIQYQHHNLQQQHPIITSANIQDGGQSAQQYQTSQARPVPVQYAQQQAGSHIQASANQLRTATDPLTDEISQMNIHDLPPPPPASEFVPPDSATMLQFRQSSVTPSNATAVPNSASASVMSESVSGIADQEVAVGQIVNQAVVSGLPLERLIPRQPNDPMWAPDFYLEKVITMYEYTQDKNDELTFTENQIIYVIKKNDDGWWEGIMNGITGLFPGNYVEPFD